MRDDAAVERRLAREASENCLGILGNRIDGVNVARVEVSWYFEDEAFNLDEHAGHFLVHATGQEPDAISGEGTIYAVFERLTHAAMDERQQREGFDGWQIDDISAA